VSAKLKLEIAFCYFGDLFLYIVVSLPYAKIIGRIIPEVTEVLCNVLKEYIQVRMK
jgi:hypothetical protein